MVDAKSWQRGAQATTSDERREADYAIYTGNLFSSSLWHLCYCWAAWPPNRVSGNPSVPLYVGNTYSALHGLLLSSRQTRGVTDTNISKTGIPLLV